MAALAASFLTDPFPDPDIARELAEAREEVARYKGVLARRDVTGTWATKIGWQLAACERGLARLEKRAAA